MADDLFGDSSSDGGDTDDLIATARSSKPVAKKKKLQNKGDSNQSKADRIPDADNDDDSDDAKSPDIRENDEEAALFDSDEDSDGAAKKKPMRVQKIKKKKKSKKENAGSTKKLSKKERMEALRAKKRQASAGDESAGVADLAAVEMDDEKREKMRKERKERGYDSGDSYDSGTFERTKEDDDFIDNDDEDPDALKELYAEQHFDDERPDDESDEEGRGRRNKKKSKKKRSRGPDALSDDDLNGDEVPDNPIMAAVHRMKKKKKVAKKLSELEEIAKEFLEKMSNAANDDEKAVAEKRPAVKKLAMLPEVLDMLTNREMMRPLLDYDLLSVCKRWIQPLPNGMLGTVTVRQRLLQAVGNMTGEQGVTANDLKRSSFGKVVMSLYMHKSETPELKRQHKALIEQWSRPIFQKSGNMKDLERVQANRRDAGIVGFARAQQAAAAPSRGKSDRSHSSGRNEEDLTSIIQRGNTAARDLGNNRVRVPFSKGFQFTVRPASKTGDVSDKRARAAQVKDGRDALNKRMLEKNRPVSKNQRSANMSIEGRPVK